MGERERERGEGREQRGGGRGGDKEGEQKREKQKDHAGKRYKTPVLTVSCKKMRSCEAYLHPMLDLCLLQLELYGLGMTVQVEVILSIHQEYRN